MIKFKQVLHN